MRPGLQSRYSYPFIDPDSVAVPDGDAGITATVRQMEKLVHGPKGVRSWVVRQAAVEAVRGVERGQPEIDSVFEWVRDNIEFRGEYGELLQSPEATINLQAGDCDDQSTLIAALLSSLGFETRFRTLAMREDPGEYSHVYAEVRDKRSGEWTPLDTTVQGSFPGWQPDGVARTETYGVMAPASANNNGLIGRLFSFLR
jgi:transglutaminase-like putative cysteine protease